MEWIDAGARRPMVSISGAAYERFERAARARGVSVSALVDLAFRDGVPTDIRVPVSKESPPTAESTIGTWRVDRRMTRVDLAHRLGADERRVRAWERGARPHPKFARKLRAMGCEVTWSPSTSTEARAARAKVGAELRRWRENADILQRDLAKRLGIGQSLLSTIETGRVPLPAAVAARIVALGGPDLRGGGA